ncbi:FtsK/SpoIIIE family DNA translocase [Chakrabartyella piscis]|uniref:FtsK/SpoIIIE family DNA translocase n=1 Tax=Chakrabartyella piscis TaxID=2918914 RepID=UPI002958637E|nr:DNA translocase FtsK [Chakrabartyella piscis]
MAERKTTTKTGTTKKTGTAAKTAAKSTAKKTTTKKTATNAKTTSGTTSRVPERYGNSIVDEIIVILILVLSVVAIISLVTGKMGVFGTLCNGLLQGLFGFGGVLVPIGVLGFGVWYLMTSDRTYAFIRGFGGVLFVLCVSALIQVLHPVSSLQMSVLDVIPYYYSEGGWLNGGLLGGLLGDLLTGALDVLGSVILLIALMIIGFIMGTGKSAIHLIEAFFIHRKVRKKIHNEKVKSKAEQIRQREIVEEERQRKLEERKRERNLNFVMKQKQEEMDEPTEIQYPRTKRAEYAKKSLATIEEAIPKDPAKFNFQIDEPELELGWSRKAVPVESVVAEPVAEKVIPFPKKNNRFEIVDEEPEATPEMNAPEMNIPEEDAVSDDFAYEDEYTDIPVMGASIADYAENELNKLDAVEDNSLADLQDLERVEAQMTKPTPPVVPPAPTAVPVMKEIPKTEVKSVAKEVLYIYPPISLLGRDPQSGGNQSKAEMLENAKKLESTLKSFGVEAKVIQINKGPTVTRYELSPSQGVKVSKIVNLADDIALNLAASGIRIEAPIPGKAAVGIEVPNKETQSVYLRTVVESDTFKNHPSKVAFALGEDITGQPVVTDIAKMPHLLIAGATGSGKSVCINTLITSILYKADPKEVKLLLIDPKVVELSVYNGIPHLMIPVVTDPKKASAALNWAVREMLQRYNDFAAFGVRDMKGFNALKEREGDPDAKMAQIVIIIDELADLMMAASGEVEDAICRLAQMARAAGMHLIIATQRPSVDVITGVIKANIPSRMAFAVSSGIDSRTILDMVGAEKLMGKGDMLFSPAGQGKPERLQGAFVTDSEVEEIVSFLRKSGKPTYTEETIEEITAVAQAAAPSGEGEDELFEKAVEMVIEKEKGSASMLQRQFRIGFTRAGRLIDAMERHGIVGEDEGNNKPRRVRITMAQWYEMKNPSAESEPIEEEIN